MSSQPQISFMAYKMAANYWKVTSVRRHMPTLIAFYLWIQRSHEHQTTANGEQDDRPPIFSSIRWVKAEIRALKLESTIVPSSRPMLSSFKPTYLHFQVSQRNRTNSRRFRTLPTIKWTVYLGLISSEIGHYNSKTVVC